MTTKEKALFVLRAQSTCDPRYIVFLLRMQARTNLATVQIERRIKELAR